MIIKKLDKEDITKTLGLVDEFIIHNYNNENYVSAWIQHDFYLSEFEKLDKSNFTTFIAKTDSRNDVMGFIMGSEGGQKIYDIRQHYVSLYFRQNHVAKNLKNALTNYAKDKGYWAITSDVLKDNIASNKLNESCKWNRLDLDEQTYRYYKILQCPTKSSNI